MPGLEHISAIPHHVQTYNCLRETKVFQQRNGESAGPGEDPRHRRLSTDVDQDARKRPWIRRTGTTVGTSFRRTTWTARRTPAGQVALMTKVVPQGGIARRSVGGDGPRADSARHRQDAEGGTGQPARLNDVRSVSGRPRGRGAGNRSAAPHPSARRDRAGAPTSARAPACCSPRRARSGCRRAGPGHRRAFGGGSSRSCARDARRRTPARSRAGGTGPRRW